MAENTQSQKSTPKAEPNKVGATNAEVDTKAEERAPESRPSQHSLKLCDLVRLINTDLTRAPGGPGSDVFPAIVHFDTAGSTVSVSAIYRDGTVAYHPGVVLVATEADAREHMAASGDSTVAFHE